MLAPRFRSLLLLLITPLLFSMAGCSYVETHRYDDSKIDLMTEGSGKVAIVTQDLRPQVTRGDFGPDYTGIVRAFFGNASIVTTASHRSLAEDVTRTISEALRSRGFEPVVLIAAPNDDPRTIRDKINAADAPHTVLIQLREWHSSTWMRTAIKYSMTIDLESKEGMQRASVSNDGRKSLGGALFHPFIFAQQALPRFYKEQLEDLLNREEARSVLAH